MENAVYNHLIYKEYNVQVRILGTKEIDFIAEKKAEKKYIQVAPSITDPKTLEREFGNLKNIKDNYPKTVVTMDSFPGTTVDGIEAFGFEKFSKFLNWEYENK